LILFYLYLFIKVLQPSFGGCVVKRRWLFLITRNIYLLPAQQLAARHS